MYQTYTAKSATVQAVEATLVTGESVVFINSIGMIERDVFLAFFEPKTSQPAPTAAPEPQPEAMTAPQSQAPEPQRKATTRTPRPAITLERKPGTGVDAMLAIIAEKPLTNGGILKALHERGFVNITVDSLSAMLSTQKTKGKIYRDDATVCWHMTPAGVGQGVRA